mmetsp:Transcript_40101/g.103819  ORF Transcript_40101/g.103819 Transcript_40101/m.103819 type:complete len:86 (+) Transcript_40101:361-618(+)
MQCTQVWCLRELGYEVTSTPPLPTLCSLPTFAPPLPASPSSYLNNMNTFKLQVCTTQTRYAHIRIQILGTLLSPFSHWLLPALLR